MPTDWDDALERKLLMCFAFELTRPSFEDVAKRMGEDFTESAIR